MQTKKIMRASLVLMALHIVLTMVFSCGIINKQKSKSSSSRNTELLNSESGSETSEEQFSEWQKGWMQDLQYTGAMIYSDSTITYHPDGGFQLTRGSLLFTQINQKESALEEGNLQNRSNSTQTNKLQQEKEDEQNKVILSNTEKRSPQTIILIAVIALAIITLHRRLRKA